ncbi:hypothetical protein L7F22_048098 [Adiantum nelumboides]|nr:hypothetical protein [Adiantum nelumboides]
MASMRFEGLASQLLQGSASGRQLAVFSLPLLPLLAEAAVTWAVCRGYLSKYKAECIPTSIKNIQLMNVFLTMLLLGTTLAEGGIVSFKYMLPESNRIVDLAMEYTRATPELLSNSKKSWSATVESVWRGEADKWDAVAAAAAAADEALGGVALGLIWVVVVVYTGAVWWIALRVKKEVSGVWSAQALRKLMRAVDRSKGVGLGLMLLFSAYNCSGFLLCHGHWRHHYVYGYGNHNRAAQLSQLWGFLRDSLSSKRGWRWNAAASTLLLHAFVSLYALAARVALHISCKRFSLTEPEDFTPLV